MRVKLLTTAALCGIALAAPVFAQPAPNPPSAAAPAGPSPTKAPEAAVAAPAAAPAPAPAAEPAPAAAAAPPAAPPEAAPAAAPAAPASDAAEAPKPAPKKPMMTHGTMSGMASNIDESNTRSEIAPRLPMPKLGMNASPADYLKAAKMAIKMKRSGEAQEALEMAETRQLDRSTPADQASMPDGGPVVSAIHMALGELAKKDMKGADMAIDKAMSASMMK